MQARADMRDGRKGAAFLFGLSGLLCVFIACDGACDGHGAGDASRAGDAPGLAGTPAAGDAPDTLAAPSALTTDVPGAEFERAARAFDRAWQRQAVAFTKALFVVAKAAGYGRYLPRASSRFAPGEPLVVYAEPVGFAHKRRGRYFYVTLDVDIEIRNETGQILLSEEGFARIDQGARSQIREFQTSLEFTVEGLPTGAHLLVIEMRDRNSARKGQVVLPFEITGADL